MSIPGLDDIDMEFAEYDDSEGGEAWDDIDGDSESDIDSESYIDGDDYDAESRSSDRRRRARQHRIARARQQRVMQARRRQAQTRARARDTARRPSAPGRATPQQAVAAIRNLDLETKVQEDTFRRSISTQNMRMSRSEYAAVAGAAATQFMDSFDTPDNPYAKAALRFAPLLLLSPQRKGTGLEGFVKDPRVIGGIAVLGITAIGENRHRVSQGREISVVAPGELVQNQQDVFLADVLDGRGAVISSPVSWKSSDPAVVSIAADGGVEAKKPGTVVITAQAGDIIKRVRVAVTPGTAQPAAAAPQPAAAAPQPAAGGPQAPANKPKA